MQRTERSVYKRLAAFTEAPTVCISLLLPTDGYQIHLAAQRNVTHLLQIHSSEFAPCSSLA